MCNPNASNDVVHRRLNGHLTFSYDDEDGLEIAGEGTYVLC
jgi:hypothetical protein